MLGEVVLSESASAILFWRPANGGACRRQLCAAEVRSRSSFSFGSLALQLRLQLQLQLQLRHAGRGEGARSLSGRHGTCCNCCAPETGAQVNWQDFARRATKRLNGWMHPAGLPRPSAQRQLWRPIYELAVGVGADRLDYALVPARLPAGAAELTSSLLFPSGLSDDTHTQVHPCQLSGLFNLARCWPRERCISNALPYAYTCLGRPTGLIYSSRIDIFASAFCQTMT